MMSRRNTTARPGSHDVALVISDLHGGGTQRVLSTLANTWSKKGLRLCVITFSEPITDKYVLHPNITRVSLSLLGRSETKFLGLLVNLRRIRTLRRALRRADAPIILSFLAATNVLTILASVGLDSRIVVSERNDPDRQPLDSPWSTLRRRLYRYADAITANSHGALESLRSFVPRRKLFFVPNPVALPAVSTREGSGHCTILSVGQLSHQKAQDVLLEAFALVVARKSDWNLVIVGDGPRRQELLQQALSLGILDRVEWIGWTTDIGSYYKKARIFVLPSRYEGMPNVLLEAMSFGLPAIVTDASPGPLEHIVDGETGLVVPVEDVNRLASAIVRLAENRELRSRLGVAARERVEELRREDLEGAWAPALGLSPDMLRADRG